MIDLRMNAIRPWYLVVVLAAVCIAGYSQPPPDAPDTELQPPKKLRPRDPEKPEEEEKLVRINHADIAFGDMARNMWYLFRDEENSEGPIEFQDGDTKLFCDEAIYNENDDTAACAGNLRIIDQESEITGDHINADFDAEVAIIQGNVKIVTTKTVGEEDDQEDQKEPEKRVTTIWCDRIEYTYTENQRRAVATGSIRAVQKDRTLFAQRADYDLEEEIVQLGDDITIKTEEGDEIKCKQATISTVDDWVRLRPITALLVRDRGDKEKQQQPEGGGEQEGEQGGEQQQGEQGQQTGGRQQDEGRSKEGNSSGAGLTKTPPGQDQQ